MIAELYFNHADDSEGSLGDFANELIDYIESVEQTERSQAAAAAACERSCACEHHTGSTERMLHMVSDRGRESYSVLLSAVESEFKAY